MNTRCINATPHEAKALHEGRATAIVRRLQKQPEKLEWCYEWRASSRQHWQEDHNEPGGGKWMPRCVWPHKQTPPSEIVDYCPYGRVGDVLEFREAYSSQGWFAEGRLLQNASESEPDTVMIGSVYYRADGDKWQEGRRTCKQFARDIHGHCGWYPASQMPRAYIRTRRVIASIEVLRVAEMTEEQLRRVGVEADIVDSGGFTPWGDGIDVADWHTPFHDDYVTRHGDGSWDKDWAWYVTLTAAKHYGGEA